MIEKRKSSSHHTICPRCGTSFTCGVASGKARCWCTDRSAALAVHADRACLCPACVRRIRLDRRTPQQ